MRLNSGIVLAFLLLFFMSLTLVSSDDLSSQGIQQYKNGLVMLSLLLGFKNFLLFLVILILLFIVSYVYISLALMSIAKKTKTSGRWMAWFPLLNLVLLSRIAKIPWWPVLLGLIPLLLIFGGLAYELLPLLLLFLIIFILYYFILGWKTFEAVGRPGWWILSILIPYVGWPLYWVLLGIAAWRSPMEVNERQKDFSRKIKSIKTKNSLRKRKK